MKRKGWIREKRARSFNREIGESFGESIDFDKIGRRREDCNQRIRFKEVPSLINQKCLWGALVAVSKIIRAIGRYLDSRRRPIDEISRSGAIQFRQGEIDESSEQPAMNPS